MAVQKVRSLGCGEKWTVGVGTNAHTNVRSKTNNEGNLTNHKVTDRIPENVVDHASVDYLIYLFI